MQSLFQTLILWFFISSSIVLLILYIFKHDQDYYNRSSTASNITIEPREINVRWNSKNAFEKIDVIYYINLDSRPDRKQEVLSQLQKTGLESSRLIRIPGVIAKFGALGCSMAHLNALYHARDNGYKTFLIVEDDFTFHDIDKAKPLLAKFWNLNIDWDILILSGNIVKSSKTFFNFFSKILNCQTTGGYVVNSLYLPTLIDNFTTGIENLSLYNSAKSTYCIDIYWKILQPNDNWYVLSPLIGYQKEGYSDIEKTNVSYDIKSFDNGNKTNIEYIVCSKTCQSRYKQNSKQISTLKTLCSKYPIMYFSYFANELQTEDYIYNVADNVIVFKCKDDYLNVSHKMGLMFKFLQSLVINEYPNLKGILFTDDDVVIYPSLFYSFLNTYQHELYWGNVAVSSSDSKHIKYKINENKQLCDNIKEHYPALAQYNINPTKVRFCSGGGFFLQTQVLHHLVAQTDLFTSFPKDNEKLLSFLKDGKFENLNVFDDVNVAVALARINIFPKHVPVKRILHWDNM